MSKKEFINMFIEDLVGHGPNGLEIKDEKLKSLCIWQYNNMNNGKVDYEDWVSQFVMELYLALDRFDANEFEWEEIVHKSGKYQWLTKFLYTSVSGAMINYANANKGSYVQSDGVKVLVTHNVDSINKVHDEDLEICNSLTESNSLVDNHEYFKSDIGLWFSENRKDFLTKTQNELLDCLLENGLGLETPKEVLQEVTGKSKANILIMFNTIGKRTVQAYNDEFGTNYVNFSGGLLKNNKEKFIDGKIYEVDVFGLVREIAN